MIEQGTGGKNINAASFGSKQGYPVFGSGKDRGLVSAPIVLFLGNSEFVN
ncbi:hypothetical protein [Caballeronia sp.]